MELKDYLIPLRKWWWLIVAATLVATASSFLATRQQPFIYTARATLMVGRAIQSTNPQDYEITASQQLGQTYANLAGRRPIKEGVQAALGLTRLPAYTAKMVPNAQLLEIQVIDTDPERAAGGGQRGRQPVDPADAGRGARPAAAAAIPEPGAARVRDGDGRDQGGDPAAAHRDGEHVQRAADRRHPGPDRGAGAEADVLPERVPDLARFRPGRREHPPGGRAGRGSPTRPAARTSARRSCWPR